jgi:hypothetical protein
MSRDSDPLTGPLDLLVSLRSLRARMARDKERADELTRRLRPLLADPLDFIDDSGEKVTGYGAAPEQMYVDVEELAELVDDETLQSVLKPRSVDNEAYRAAVQAGRIPEHVFTRVTRLRPQTWRVLFKPME